MILYLDTSAYVKQYILERGTQEVFEILERADRVGTSLITRAEMEAAFAKYARMGALSKAVAWALALEFRSDWPKLVLLDLTEETAVLAGELAWEHGLRGYDAMHLASALRWQRLMQEPITLATFDRGLWRVAADLGLQPFPPDLDALTPS